MRVRIIGKNVSITKGIKAYAMKKISKLEKYIIVPEDISVRVLIRTYKTAQKVEVTIPTKFGVLRAESKGEDAYAALDLAVDKLADQIRRQKTCIQRRNKESLTDAFLMEEDAEPDAEIKTKIVDIHHMSADEAFVNCFRQRDST